MLASASPSDYTESLRILLTDPDVDMVMVVMPPPPAFTAGGTVKMMIPVIQVQEKPVVVVLMGERLIQEGVALCRAARIPDYRFPEEAANVLGALYQRTRALARLVQPAAAVSGVDLHAARARTATPAPGGWLAPDQTQAMLADYGIQTLPLRLATTADEAAAIARELGFPLVMKVASADIPHKSDMGGVLLDLRDEAAVRQGFQTILERARAAQPKAQIDGVHLQRMLGAGQEVIVGVVRDPQFGPLVMFGSGGVEVEGLKDVAFALAPLSVDDAQEMLRSTWAGRKLAGFRHLPPADESAAVDTLIRLAQLAHDNPRVAEIEINPLRVMPQGQGAFAIDARARIGANPA